MRVTAVPFLAVAVLVALGSVVPEVMLPWLILGTVVLTLAAIWRWPPDLVRALVTCPACGGKQETSVTPGTCPKMHHCMDCGVRSAPHPGDPCTLCSFGSSRCPPAARIHDCR
jgi:hypothetical protein